MIHLVDFGLAEPFADILTHKHRPYCEGHELAGTARYASLHAHKGVAQTRRDDIISLSYILLYFARGSLPWQDISRSNKTERYELIAKAKENAQQDSLCKGLPLEFAVFFDYARSLGFSDRPDYTYIRDLFNRSLLRGDRETDDSFDWELNPAEDSRRV